MQHPKLLETPRCKKFALMFFKRTLACIVSRAKGFCNISGWRNGCSLAHHVTKPVQATPHAVAPVPILCKQLAAICRASGGF